MKKKFDDMTVKEHLEAADKAIFRLRIALIVLAVVTVLNIACPTKAHAQERPKPCGGWNPPAGCVFRPIGGPRVVYRPPAYGRNGPPAYGGNVNGGAVNRRAVPRTNGYGGNSPSGYGGNSRLRVGTSGSGANGNGTATNRGFIPGSNGHSGTSGSGGNTAFRPGTSGFGGNYAVRPGTSGYSGSSGTAGNTAFSHGTSGSGGNTNGVGTSRRRR